MLELDRGGEEDEEDDPIPGAFNDPKPTEPYVSDEEEADIDAALKVTPIVESLEYVCRESDVFVPWITAQQIGFEIAPEKALSVAVKPEDSQKDWKEAMA